MRRPIVSSQEFPPASYPLYADTGTREDYALDAPRTRERYWLYGLLFALTLLTTTMVGAAMQIDFDRNVSFDVERAFLMYSWVWRHPVALLQGLPFSLTLLTILLAHEFGHYLAAMHHGVDASLPYFLPSPLLGTFGAFIRVRSPIYSKRVLFDIGVSGPIAGFVFLLPALSIGLAFSKVIPGIAHQGNLVFGVPSLLRLMEGLIFPGTPVADIYLHPVARAAWVGMFTTALNLLPIGQLDGGHILYAFFPAKHRMVSRVVALLLLPLAYFSGWPAWAFWGVVMLWLGRYHPMIMDAAELSYGRRELGWLAAAIFVLCFMFTPVR
jgi:membrane-associated protease RseP (regulator of RpoE activity)